MARIMMINFRPSRSTLGPAVLVVVGLALGACAARPTSLPSPAVAVTSPPPTVAPTPTSLPPTAEPAAAATLGFVFPIIAPTASVPAASLADLPGNMATGGPAPDFSARVMGGGGFTLSKQRGSPVLLFPTVPGCGDCIFVMQEISAAYPDYRGRGIKVVILDLDPEDRPEFWQVFADYIGEPEFIWGVVDSTDFVVQYNITSLGTTLLVDPGGKMVFRSQYPVLADGFRQLFDLATR